MTKKQTKAPLPSIASELARVEASLLRESPMDEQEAMKKALAEEAAKRHQRDIGDFRACLLRPEARRVIYRIIEESKAFAPSFDRDPGVMAYNEGQRSIGCFIFGLAEAAEPGICLKMARETTSDRKAQESRQKKIMEEGNAD